MKKYQFVKSLIISFSLLFAGMVFAEDPAPTQMLKNTSTQMTKELDQHLGNLKNNTPLVEGIVRRILLPHFDLNTMSKLIVGRNYWDQGGNSAQSAFVDAFTRYVIRTYSVAISSYEGETIKFYPLREDIAVKDRVQINSTIFRKSGPDIQVQYRLLNASGNWRIYDFSVGGVSIVQNYRSQFAEPLQQGGLAHLVNQIKSRTK
jgi:phospholipid transport system substrate-binding protein